MTKAAARDRLPDFLMIGALASEPIHRL